MQTYVYIDGFNLYYRALKDTQYKWLNVDKLCTTLLPRNKILRIKYFTAKVGARLGDPDQPVRQQMYLRALKTLPNVRIIYGHFLTHIYSMPLAGSSPKDRQYAKVVKTEEKGSDVNLASHLLNDGYKGEYQAAVLITNDSDFKEPVRMVREELKLPVGIINPQPGKASRELVRRATFVKTIRPGLLARSQFPNTLQDANGSFSKPSSW